MKKIIYLDIWEKGYRNFLRLDESFIRQGYQTMLLHTGSFYEQKSPVEHKLGTLLSRDIRFYNTFLIKKALKQEKPDLVIMLNLSFIFDRALVNICKSENIRIVYLSHGKLIAPEEAEQEAEKLNSNIRSNLSRVFRLKNFYVFANYISSLSGLKRFTSPVKLLFGVLRKPSGFLTFPQFTEELDADKMLVYTDEDQQLLTKHFGFPTEKVIVTGNPEISAFMQSASRPREEFLNQLGLESDQLYFVYLDDGLVCDKLITARQWEESLMTLSELTEKMGYRFVLKLHPRTDKIEFTETFRSLNILAISDCDFKNLLNHAEFVVSHLSTTILYALLFYKQVYVPFWGIFSTFAKNYPENVVSYCMSEADLINKIKENATANQKDYNDYLQKNGINLKENALNTIVREITNLIQ